MRHSRDCLASRYARHRDHRLRAAIGGVTSPCGSGAGWAVAVDRRGGCAAWMNVASWPSCGTRSPSSASEWLTGPRTATERRRGLGKEELMKRAIMGVSAAAVIALAPLCIPPAQAHADDPCVSITDPDAHQACIDDFVQRREKAQCDASPHQGQLGQLCG